MKVPAGEELRGIFNTVYRVFPVDSKIFCKEMSDIQKVRGLFSFFITKVGVDQIIVRDKTVVSVPARLIGLIELCGRQNILIFKICSSFFSKGFRTRTRSLL